MKIRGNTVGTTMKRADWDQDDKKKSDYIKNKPKLLISGWGKPNAETEGGVGTFYFDNRKQILYLCTEVGKWAKVDLTFPPKPSTLMNGNNTGGAWEIYTYDSDADVFLYYDNNMSFPTEIPPGDYYVSTMDYNEYIRWNIIKTNGAWEYDKNNPPDLAYYLIDSYPITVGPGETLVIDYPIALTAETGVTVVVNDHYDSPRLTISGGEDHSFTENGTYFITPGYYWISVFRDTDYTYELKRNGIVVSSGYCFELSSETDTIELKAGDEFTVIYY